MAVNAVPGPGRVDGHLHTALGAMTAETAKAFNRRRELT